MLQGICSRVDGALAVSLISLDGIAIDSINEHDLNLETIGAEFGGFIHSIRPNEELNTGEVQQFSLMTDRYITILSEVTSEYYVLLVLEPGGNYGRARFELSKARESLRKELS